MRLLATVSALALFGAGAAFAGGHGANEGKCFDKTTLTYKDCPEPAPAEEPAAEPAMMKDDGGFYVAARGGASFFQDTDFDLSAVNNVENEYDTGYIFSGAVGYDWGHVTPGLGVRTELELGYQSADVDDHLLNGASLSPTNPIQGDTSALFGFVSVYGDVALTERLDLILGGGAGLGQVDFEDHGLATVLLDDDETVFGYHLDAGLGYEIVDHVTLEVSYRWQSFVGVDNTTVGGFDSDTNLDTHNVMAGVRFGF